MTLEEIKEKYAYDESGWVCCCDCPLFVEDDNGDLKECIGYENTCDGKEGAYKRIQRYLNGESGMVVLYVDWSNEEIYSAREYNEMVKELEDTNDEEFFDWLNLHYSAAYIFKMDEEDRKDVYNKFLAECRKDTEETCNRCQRVEVEL